jgi:integrase
VFPAAKGTSGHTTGLQKAWSDLRAIDDLDDVRLHDVHHSFASFAVANNQNIYLISRALGHANTRTTERYLPSRRSTFAIPARLAITGEFLHPPTQTAPCPFRWTAHR